MRVRRRLGLGAALALAIALIGSGPLAHDPSLRKLVTQDKARVSEQAIAPNIGLVPTDPVASTDGVIGGVASVAGQTSPPPTKSERLIQAAPKSFVGAAPKAVAPPAAIADPSIASQGSRSTGTWAVVIGVNDYPGSENDLQYAVNDANEAASMLSNFGVDSDHMLVMRDGQVTGRTLLDSISWLAAHAATDSTAVFFYAGHVRKTNAGNEEIVTSDGSSVSDSQLATALNRVVASRSWVAIAACYGGGFTEVLKPGRVLTAAAGANSLAYENASIGHSYMVEYMVRRAMNQGRASATVQTAFNYAVDNISRDHPGREPVEFDNGSGSLDLRPPTSTNRPTTPTTAPANSPTTELPAGDRPPSKGQHCSGSGLFRFCSPG